MQSTTIYCSNCGASNRPNVNYCFGCGEVIYVGTLLGVVGTGRIPPQQMLKQRYRIITLVGQGGMGAVYKAEDTQFGNRLVAVKEMSQSNLSPQDATEATNQFKQEANLLANLKHPNLPSIYDYFGENGRWYLVMDFIEGTTLDARLGKAAGRFLTINETLDIGIQLSKVLGYLHTRAVPIIFRDLKPLNIMVTPEDNIYLIDFGIARLFKVGKAKDTVAYVSAGYAAPEQFGRAQTSPQSDIYSLGATLHQLLSGSDPSANSPLFTFKPLSYYNQNVPNALADLVAKMVNTDPALRPTSIAEVRKELERILMQVKQLSNQLPLTQYVTNPARPNPSYSYTKPQYYGATPSIQKQGQVYNTLLVQMLAKRVLPKSRVGKTLLIGTVTGILFCISPLFSTGWLAAPIDFLLLWAAGLIAGRFAMLRNSAFFVGVVAIVIWCVIELVTQQYLYSYYLQEGIVTVFIFSSFLGLICGLTSWISAMFATSGYLYSKKR